MANDGRRPPYMCRQPARTGPVAHQRATTWGPVTARSWAREVTCKLNAIYNVMIIHVVKRAPRISMSIQFNIFQIKVSCRILS